MAFIQRLAQAGEGMKRTHLPNCHKFHKFSQNSHESSYMHIYMYIYIQGLLWRTARRATCSGRAG